MNPKQRYRERQKLRSAMANVLYRLALNAKHNIPPDKATAKVANGVVRELVRFMLKAGVEPADPPADFQTIIDLHLSSMRESAKRKARRERPPG